MPLKPNLMERFLLRIGVIPSVLLDTGVSMFQASALLTAGDIGLFTHLKDGPLSLNEIKARTHASVHGLAVLLMQRRERPPHRHRQAEFAKAAREIELVLPLDRGKVMHRIIGDAIGRLWRRLCGQARAAAAAFRFR